MLTFFRFFVIHEFDKHSRGRGEEKKKKKKKRQSLKV